MKTASCIRIALIAVLGFFMTLPTMADVDHSSVRVRNGVIKLTTPSYSGSGSPSQVFTIPGNGREVMIPEEYVKSIPSVIRFSFEIDRTDAEGNTFDMKNFNLTEFGINGMFVGDRNLDSIITSAGLLADYAIQDVVYTNGETSPSANQGMHVCPFDKDGKLIAALVGCPVNDPNGVVMDGTYKVSSNPASTAIHRVKVKGMPLALPAEVVDYLQILHGYSPQRTLGIALDTSMTVDISLNPLHGCRSFPTLVSTTKRVMVTFTPPGPPSLEMTKAKCEFVIRNADMNILNFGRSTNLQDWETVSNSEYKIYIFGTDAYITGLTPDSRPAVFYRLQMPDPQEVARRKALIEALKKP